MIPVYTTLISKITAVLNGVTQIKKVYNYPVLKVEAYPAVIFFPDALQNSFETNQDNLKTVRFKLYVVVGSAQKDKFDIFSTVLPNAVDAVVQAFDHAWDGGTLNGRRIWCLLSNGSWTMGEDASGLEAQAELTLEFKLTTAV